MSTMRADKNSQSGTCCTSAPNLLSRTRTHSRKTAFGPATSPRWLKSMVNRHGHLDSRALGVGATIREEDLVNGHTAQLLQLRLPTPKGAVRPSRRIAPPLQTQRQVQVVQRPEHQRVASPGLQEDRDAEPRCGRGACDAQADVGNAAPATHNLQRHGGVPRQHAGAGVDDEQLTTGIGSYGEAHPLLELHHVVGAVLCHTDGDAIAAVLVELQRPLAGAQVAPLIRQPVGDDGAAGCGRGTRAPATPIGPRSRVGPSPVGMGVGGGQPAKRELHGCGMGRDDGQRPQSPSGFSGNPRKSRGLKQTSCPSHEPVPNHCGSGTLLDRAALTIMPQVAFEP